MTIKNNQANGEFMDNFEKGKLKQEGNYVNGEVDGEANYWYPSGKLNGTVHYVMGAKPGNRLFFLKTARSRLKPT
jgi:antitoxin component YwqK of YwqJK toxin-antitoxin module